MSGPVGNDRGLVFVVGGQVADSDAETVDLENPVPENCDEPADFPSPAIYDAAGFLMSNGAPAICGGKVARIIQLAFNLKFCLREWHFLFLLHHYMLRIWPHHAALKGVSHGRSGT